MKKTIMAVLILLGLSSAVLAAPFYSISAINQKNFAEKTFETEGYIVFIYKCPPCPKEAVCQPCPPPFVIISEKKKEIQYPDQMKQTELLVNTGFKEGLKLMQKYRLTVVVKPYGSGRDMELVDFKLIPNRTKKSKSLK